MFFGVLFQCTHLISDFFFPILVVASLSRTGIPIDLSEWFDALLWHQVFQPRKNGIWNWCVHKWWLTAVTYSVLSACSWPLSQCSNYFRLICSSRHFVFWRLCLGSLFSTVSFKIKYFKPVSVHLGMPISSVPIEFGCDTKMFLSWKYLWFWCLWLSDKKPFGFVAEFCYSGWYMVFSV